MKMKIIISGIIIVLVLYIIFLHCTTTTEHAGVTPITRSLLTLDIWGENEDIEQYLRVLEMLDENDIDAAKERIQQLLYIRIMVPPQWELLDSSGALKAERLKAERIELLKRIKKYHEEHKDEIDVNLPLNKRAVQQFDNLM